MPTPHQHHTFSDALELDGPAGLAFSPFAQAALVSAQIAIARALSVSLIAPMPPPRPLALSAQAQHYLQLQSQLQAWIDRGGFAQDDDASTIRMTDCTAPCID